MAFNPYFFNDSPLPMELIQKALIELNGIVPTVTELKATVDKLVADLDGAIQEEVQRVINEMYENGEFSQILEDLATDFFENISAPKEFKIDTRREFRVALPAQTYNTTTFEEELYSYCQGGCMFKRQGVLYYIGCYKVSNKELNTANYKNDNADLRLYCYLDNKWQLVRHNVYSVGHANDIKYIESIDKFFVVQSAIYNGGSTENGTKDITVIDWTLPALHDATFTFDGFLPNRDRITCIDYYNNKYWAFIGSGGDSPIQIYTFDLDENYIVSNIETYAIKYLPYSAGTNYVMIGAGFAQNDDFIFFGNTAPAGIYRLNKRTKNIDCFYEIGESTNNSMYLTGEMENLSLVDNILYIGTTTHSFQAATNNPNYWDYNQVFSFDFINNLTVPNQVYTSYGGSRRVLTIGNPNSDANIDGAIREISNPNGLTGDNGLPFQTWGEAFLSIRANKTWTDIELKPITRNMVEYVVIEIPDRNIFINGVDFYNNHIDNVTDVTDAYPHIGGIYIEGSHVTADHLWIENRTPTTLSSAFTESQVYARFSIINFLSCLFRLTGRPNSILFNINRSFADIGSQYLYSNPDTAVNFNDTRATLYAATVNFHGHWTGDSTTNVIATYVSD